MTWRGVGALLCLVSCIAAPAPRLFAEHDDEVAYICCRSERISVCLGPGAATEDKAVFACNMIHERMHVNWLEDNAPDACTGQGDGRVYVLASPAEIRRLECEAYQREARCLIDARRYRQAMALTTVADMVYNCTRADS